MAWDYNIQTLVDNERKLVVQFRAKSDGSTALSAVAVVTPSDFTSSITGKTCDYVSIDRIWASNAGGCIATVLWDATPDYIIHAYCNTGATSSAYFHDFTIGDWGGLRPPGVGNTTISANTGGDNAGAGTVTKEIKISGTGASSSDTISVVLECVKHYA